MSTVKTTLALLAVAFAVGNGAALARGGANGGHGGGHSGGHFGGHSASAPAMHGPSFSARAPGSSFGPARFTGRAPVARPLVNRRLIVAAPLLVAPYYPYYSPSYYDYSPGYDSSYGDPYPYDQPPMYAPDAGYGPPPPSYYPPPPAPSSSSSRPAQRSAEAVTTPTPIYYCADSRTYTNVIADLECAGGWRKVM